MAAFIRLTKVKGEKLDREVQFTTEENGTELWCSLSSHRQDFVSCRLSPWLDVKMDGLFPFLARAPTSKVYRNDARTRYRVVQVPFEYSRCSVHFFKFTRCISTRLVFMNEPWFVYARNRPLNQSMIIPIRPRRQNHALPFYDREYRASFVSISKMACRFFRKLLAFRIICDVSMFEERNSYSIARTFVFIAISWVESMKRVEYET